MLNALSCTAFCILALASAALGQNSAAPAGPPTGPGVPAFDPGYAAVLIGSPAGGGGIPNYECIEADPCPPIAIINSAGNFGCTAACGGTCNTCSGGATSANICPKAALSTCYLASTSAVCGSIGTGSCGTTGGPGVFGPDNAGCFCTPPAVFSDTCTIVECF